MQVFGRKGATLEPGKLLQEFNETEVDQLGRAAGSQNSPFSPPRQIASHSSSGELAIFGAMNACRSLPASRASLPMLCTTLYRNCVLLAPISQILPETTSILV